MSELRAAAKALAEALEDEQHRVHDHVPEDFMAPCIVLQPAERYVTGNPADVTFADELQQVLDVWCLVEVKSNQQAADDSDALLEHVLDALPDTWGIDGVNRPGPVTTDGWQGHGVRLTVSRHITL